MIIRRLLLLGPLLVLALGLSKCDSANSGGGGSAAGRMDVVLTSSDINSARRGAAGTFDACQLMTDGGPENGTCSTPLLVTGKLASISFGNRNSSDNGGARAIDFGGGSELSTDQDGTLNLTSFDFSTTAKTENEESEDTMPETAIYFNRVTSLLASLDMKMQIPAGNPNVTNDYWTIRYVFIQQPLTDDTTIDNCLTTEQKAKIQTNGALHSAPAAFQRGDVLVCQKANVSDTCADSDFKWVDSADGSLDATRPAAPVNFSTIVGDVDCSTDQDGHPDMNLGGFGLAADLASTFTLIRGSEESGTGDPIPVYTYNGTCTSTNGAQGSCTGTEETGNSVLVTVDFDLTNAIFAHTSVDMDSDAEASILQDLDKIAFKPLYAKKVHVGQGMPNDAGIDAAVSITLQSDSE